jgi:hypothetical protein
MGITIYEKILYTLKNIDSYSNQPNKYLQKCKYLYFWCLNGIRIDNRDYYIHIDFYLNYLVNGTIEKELLKLSNKKPFPDKYLDKFLEKIKMNVKNTPLIDFVLTNEIENFRKCLVCILGKEKLLKILKKIKQSNIQPNEKSIIFYLNFA